MPARRSSQAFQRARLVEMTMQRRRPPLRDDKDEVQAHHATMLHEQALPAAPRRAAGAIATSDRPRRSLAPFGCLGGAARRGGRLAVGARLTGFMLITLRLRMALTLPSTSGCEPLAHVEPQHAVRPCWQHRPAAAARAEPSPPPRPFPTNAAATRGEKRQTDVRL